MRDLKTTTRFDAGLESMRGDYPRIDFALDNIKPSIQDRPETFSVVIGQPFSVAKLIAFEGVPDATICFRYDDQEVVLMRIDLNYV
jgi:hypothetical protein